MGVSKASDDLLQAATRCIELSDELVNAGRIEHAVAVLTVAAHAVGTSPELFCALGSILLATGDRAQASRVIHEALRRCPNDATLRELLAACTAEPPNESAKGGSLRSAYAENRGDRPTVIAYAKLLWQEGQRVTFCNVLREYLTSHPTDEEVRQLAAKPFPMAAAVGS